jgi:hypothetical protein
VLGVRMRNPARHGHRGAALGCRHLPRLAMPWAVLSFHNVIDCHWLSFLRDVMDVHTNLAVTAVIFTDFQLK